MLITPGGKPASRTACISIHEVMGASVDGFQTTLLPQSAMTVGRL